MLQAILVTSNQSIEMKIFKVWSSDRNKKIFVVVKEETNILECLITEGMYILNKYCDISVNIIQGGS